MEGPWPPHAEHAPRYRSIEAGCPQAPFDMLPRSLDARGYNCRNWGSDQTRNQSPSRLAASTTNMIHRPGSTLSHQYPAMSPDFPSESISPHAGSGGATPTPRKL